MDTIRIMLVDDQKLMLDGVQTILSIHPDYEVIATATSGEDAIQQLKNIQPDLILMDIRMPGMGGVEATKYIKEHYPDITVLILTTFDDDEYIIDALSYGASGYLLKDIDGEKLIQSVTEAISGNLLLTGKVAHKLALSAITKRENKQEYNQLVEDLEFTNRETDIAMLLVEGLTSREIADQLFLSQGTVKNYMSNIYSKIGTNDRSKAILFFKDYFKQNK